MVQRIFVGVLILAGLAHQPLLADDDFKRVSRSVVRTYDQLRTELQVCAITHEALAQKKVLGLPQELHKKASELFLKTNNSPQPFLGVSLTSFFYVDYRGLDVVIGGERGFVTLTVPIPRYYGQSGSVWKYHYGDDPILERLRDVSARDIATYGKDGVLTREQLKKVPVRE